MARWLKQHRSAQVAFAAFLVATLVFSLAFLLPTKRDGARASTATPTLSASCEGFELRLDPNTNGRVVSNGIHGTAKESVEKMLVAAKHDWKAFQSYWNDSPLGKEKPMDTTSAQKLFLNGCMTAEAQTDWYQLAGAMRSAKAEIVTAPAVARNTYANATGTFARSERITGDRTATKLTYKGGHTTTILHRCGNVINPPPPPEPRGKQESDSHVNDGFQDDEGHNVKPPPDATPVPPDDEMPQPTATGSPSPRPTSSPTTSPTPTSEPDPDPCGPHGCASPSPSPSPTPTQTGGPTEPPPED